MSEDISKLIEERSAKEQELFAYIEHAQENLILFFQGRSTEEQNLDSVFTYLSFALECREEIYEDIDNSRIKKEGTR